MAEHGVVLFHTSSSAMQAEAVLAKAGLSVRMIPTPRELSSDCGLALRFEWAAHEQVGKLLEKLHVETAGIHELA
jgi:hypothetical protein